MSAMFLNFVIFFEDFLVKVLLHFMYLIYHIMFLFCMSAMFLNFVIFFWVFFVNILLHFMYLIYHIMFLFCMSAMFLNFVIFFWVFFVNILLHFMYLICIQYFKSRHCVSNGRDRPMKTCRIGTWTWYMTFSTSIPCAPRPLKSDS